MSLATRVLLLTACIVSFACSREKASNSSASPEDRLVECQPDCSLRQCGPDGCGGYCPLCPRGFECRAGICLTEACDDGNDVPWDGCTEGFVSEFVVTDNTVGHQFHPSIAHAGPGRIVVGWQGRGVFGESGAYMRVFDHHGQPLSGDLIVGNSSSLQKEDLHLAGLGDAGFVAAWSERPPRGEGDVLAQFFSSAGVVRGEPFQLAQDNAGDQSSVAVTARAATGFYVSWSTFARGSSNFDIAARFFDANGKATTDEFIVNSSTDYDQLGSTIAVLADGRILIAWHSFHEDGSNQGLYARLYSPEGDPLGDSFPLNKHTNGSQWSAALAALPTGGFVAAWSGRGSDERSGVFGRRFDVRGVPEGPEIQINQFTAAQQQEVVVSASADGRVLFGWESWHDPENECEVLLRWYSADGAPLGDGFQVNMERWEGQGDPALAILPDVRVFVAWYSFGQDGDERGIFGRVVQ